MTFESDDYETVQGLVAAGVGVALIPRLALTRVHAGIVVRELAPRSPARKVVAATIAGAGVAPAAKTMIRVLADVAGRYTEAAGTHRSGVIARLTDRRSACATTRTTPRQCSTSPAAELGAELVGVEVALEDLKAEPSLSMRPDSSSGAWSGRTARVDDHQLAGEPREPRR